MPSSVSKIIWSTIAISNELGLEKAATTKIAKHAKVATGTLFHHFHNKKAILEATYLSIQEDFVWQLIGVFDYPKKDIEKRLKQAVKISIDYWVIHSASYRFTNQMYHSSYFGNDLQEKVDHLYLRIESGFKFGVKKGILRKQNADLLLHMMVHTAFVSAGLILETEDERKQKLIRKEGRTFIWNGMKMSK